MPVNFHQLVVNDVLIGLYLKISLEFIYYISEGIRVYEQQDKWKYVLQGSNYKKLGFQSRHWSRSEEIFI